jgi:hypothetical protein
VQRYLQACQHVKDYDDLPFTTIDFQKLMDRLLMGSSLSDITLLVPVGKIKKQKQDERSRALNAEKNKHKDHGSDKGKRNGGDNDNGGRKRNKTGDRNPDLDPSWKPVGGEWGQYTKNRDSLPTLQGQQLCLGYHANGYCRHGNKCQRAKTHTKLTGETKTAMKKWVQDAKADSA